MTSAATDGVPWLKIHVRPALLLRFLPVAATICISLTALSSITALRVALLVPVGLTALSARRSLWRFVLRGPIGLLIAWMALSLAWSENRVQTGYSLGNFALETLAAISAVALGGAIAHRYLATLLKALLVASAAVAVAVPTLGRMDAVGAPWRGVFVHKNSLGTVAAFAVVIFATTGRSTHRARWIGFTFLVLLLSESRAGLAAAATGLLVQAAAHVLYVRRPGRRTVPASLFYGALVAGGLVIWRFSATALRLAGRDPDLSGRTTVWTVVIEYAQDHLWFGSGIGAQIYRGSPLADDIFAATGSPLGTTHNGFLVVLLGLGAVGCVLYAGAIGKVFLTVERIRRQRRTDQDQVLLALGMLTCYLVLNLAEDRLLARSGWFFLMFGVLQLLHPRRVRDHAGAARWEQAPSPAAPPPALRSGPPPEASTP